MKVTVRVPHATVRIQPEEAAAPAAPPPAPPTARPGAARRRRRPPRPAPAAAATPRRRPRFRPPHRSARRRPSPTAAAAAPRRRVGRPARAAAVRRRRAAPPTARPAAARSAPAPRTSSPRRSSSPSRSRTALATTPPPVVIPPAHAEAAAGRDAPAETVVDQAAARRHPERGDGEAGRGAGASADERAPADAGRGEVRGAAARGPRAGGVPRALEAGEPPSRAGRAAPKGDGLRGDQWLYLLDGAQRGPIDVEDLIDLVLTSIPEDTKVWHPGLEGWVRANQLREIADEIPPPLPIPGAQRGYVDEDMPDFNTVPPMLRTVLIADEDAAFRKYLAMPLAAQGFTIYEAADGSAAWQLAVQNRPWMILADISMPEVDGFEFCRRVRNHPLLSRMPLLFISGSDKYKERYRALQIGADDFLSKNMPIRELLMRIQLLMTRYSDLSASGEQKPGTTEVAGAFQGRIEVFGAPALLQMCSQGRLTGLFTALAEDAANTATVMGFREGDIISATAGAATGPEGVYAFLGWEKGSFKFTPGDPGDGRAARPERRAPPARGLPDPRRVPQGRGRRGARPP